MMQPWIVMQPWTWVMIGFAALGLLVLIGIASVRNRRRKRPKPSQGEAAAKYRAARAQQPELVPRDTKSSAVLDIEEMLHEPDDS